MYMHIYRLNIHPYTQMCQPYMASTHAKDRECNFHYERRAGLILMVDISKSCVKLCDKKETKSYTTLLYDDLLLPILYISNCYPYFICMNDATCIILALN